MQFPQCRTRVQAELVGQVAACPGVHVEGVGGAAGPVQGEHLQFDQPFPGRVVAGQAGELGNELLVSAAFQAGAHQLLGRAHPQLVEIHLTNVIATQGALPIAIGDDVIGAAGVSGAPGGDKDEVCVKAGIDKVADQLK